MLFLFIYKHPVYEEGEKLKIMCSHLFFMDKRIQCHI